MRKFNNQPALNKDFIEVENNERPFATQDGSDKFLIKSYNEGQGLS